MVTCHREPTNFPNEIIFEGSLSAQTSYNSSAAHSTVVAGERVKERGHFKSNQQNVHHPVGIEGGRLIKTYKKAEWCGGGNGNPGMSSHSVSLRGIPVFLVIANSFDNFNNKLRMHDMKCIFNVPQTHHKTIKRFSKAGK